MLANRVCLCQIWNIFSHDAQSGILHRVNDTGRKVLICVWRRALRTCCVRRTVQEMIKTLLPVVQHEKARPFSVSDYEGFVSYEKTIKLWEGCQQLFSCQASLVSLVHPVQPKLVDL